MSKNAVDNNETVIVFDFCGNCELSKDVAKVLNEKVLNIDCSDFNNLQGLGYNEVTPNSDNPFEIYRCAKTKTTQLMTLVNSINENDSELKARMERYLEAAAVITFMGEGSIKDVFAVLQNHVIRHKYIDRINPNQKDNCEEYIDTLKELDDCIKNGVEPVGTKLAYVQGILNRVNKLKQNTYMEMMFKKDCTGNINLISEMQKAQLITIRMPETMFSTEQKKDRYL